MVRTEKEKVTKEVDKEIRLGDLILYTVARKCKDGVSFAELGNSIYLISGMLENKHNIFIDCGQFRNYRGGMISEEIGIEISLLKQANYIKSENDFYYLDYRAETFNPNKFKESIGPKGKDIDEILEDKKIGKYHRKISHLLDSKRFVSQMELPKHMKPESVIKTILEERGYSKEELRDFQDLLKKIELYKL